MDAARPGVKLPCRVGLIVVLAALCAGCSGSDPGPAVATELTPPSTSTVAAPVPATPAPEASTSTATSTDPAPPTTLRLADVERLAAVDGVSVSVEIGDEPVGSLDDEHPILELSLDAPVTATLRYVTAGGEPADVRWEQYLVPGRAGVVEQPWRRGPGAADGPVRLVWQALGGRAGYRAQLDATVGVTVVSPIWWYVQADGTVSDRADAGYVADAHDRGVDVWPAIAGLDADANHALLSDPAARKAVADRVSERAELIGADGVNVDIEGFREEDAADFTAFVGELAAAVRSWGGIVSYDLIPRTDSWDISPAELAFWSTAPQRRELAELVDFTILMAYDQHNRYRPSGPVASPAWVEESVRYLLRYVDPHKLVLGIPFYGRVWDPDAIDEPRAVGLGTVAALASGGERSFDPEFGLERVDLGDGRFLWVEDATVLAQRIMWANETGLAGWAAWRLGLDDATLWDSIGAL